jgi:hypothetical protein
MGGMLREQINRIKARDIVVSISFSPYAEETVMVSETAASVGARQITDSQISPLATFSDLCFVVKEAQWMRSALSQQRCAWYSHWWWRWRISWVAGSEVITWLSDAKSNCWISCRCARIACAVTNVPSTEYKTR